MGSILISRCYMCGAYMSPDDEEAHNAWHAQKIHRTKYSAKRRKALRLRAS